MLYSFSIMHYALYILVSIYNVCVCMYVYALYILVSIYNVCVCVGGGSRRCTAAQHHCRLQRSRCHFAERLVPSGCGQRAKGEGAGSDRTGGRRASGRPDRDPCQVPAGAPGEGGRGGGGERERERGRGRGVEEG